MVLVKAWFTGLTGSELGQEHKGELRKKKNIIKEMEWVIRTFRHMGGVWMARAKKMGNEKPGHMADAARETERWNR